MAITGTFAADFSPFATEAAKAEGKLRSFEGAADKAAAALNKVGDAEATGKLRKLGEEADRTTPKANAMHAAFNRFDNLLAASGVNIGSEVRALKEIGDVAGETAKGIGAVATAGLAAGTAFAAFNITSAILQFTGLDKAIGNAVDAIHDFGKSAAEAGAKQDSINLAIQRGANAHVTYGEAVRFNDEWAKKHKQSALEAAAALDTWKDVQLDLATAGEGWRGTLMGIDGAVVEAIKWYLEAGVSQEKLGKAFGLTDVQVKAVSASMAAHTEELKKLAAEDAKAAAAITAHWNDVGKIIDNVFGVDALNAATNWVDAINALGGSVANLSSNQLADLQEAMLAGIDALARSGQLTSSQSSQFANLAIQAGNALAALRPLVVTEEDLVKAQYDYALSIDKQLAAQAAANQATTEMTAVAGPARDSVLSLGSAASSAAQGFFQMSEGLFAAIRAAQEADALNEIVPKWGKINPGGIGFGPGPPPGIRNGVAGNGITITQHITQPLGTPTQISSAMTDALADRLKRLGRL